MINLIPLTYAATSLTDQGSATAQQATAGISSFFSTIYEKSPAWIAAMVVFAASFFVAKMVKERVIDRVSEKFGEEDKDVLVLIGRVTYVAVLGVGITIALKIGGIDLTPLVAAVGFGLGFAMQDLVMNFLAGILILLNRPFHIGDYIKVNETVGQVVEIQSRATILKALDGTRIIVPNAELFTTQVTSFTSNPFRRVDIELGVSYATDLAHATRVTMETIKAHPKVLHEPAPGITWTGFGDENIDCTARFWVDSKGGWVRVKSELIQAIKKAYEENGIDMAYPTRTLLFSRETEGTQVPVYSATQEERKQHLEEIKNGEAELSNQIAASAQRAEAAKVEAPAAPAILVPTPGIPVVVPASALVGNTEPPAAPAVAPAAPITPADKLESGANFLKAQPNGD